MDPFVVSQVCGVRIGECRKELSIRQKGTELVLQDSKKDGPFPWLEALVDGARCGNKAGESADAVDLEENDVNELGRQCAKARTTCIGHFHFRRSGLCFLRAVPDSKIRSVDHGAEERG